MNLWRAVGLDNIADWRAALKGGPAVCTEERVNGLQKRVGWRVAEQGGPASCRTGQASGLQKKSGLHIYTCRRIAEKGRPFETRPHCVKIITLARFRHSSGYTKWWTVRCMDGLH